MTKVKSQPCITQDIKAQIANRNSNINLTNLQSSEKIIKNNAALRCKFDS